MGQSSVYLYYSPVSDPTLGGPVTVLGGPYRTDTSLSWSDFSVSANAAVTWTLFNSQTSAVFSGYLDSAGEPIVSQFYSGVTHYFLLTNSNSTSPVGVSASSTFGCFLQATSIDTPEGTVAVEDLRPGSRVLTASGAEAVVRWVGRRAVDPCFYHPQDVNPVRIVAGAFGDLVPRRDLFLSPEHAVFVERALIPVRRLINDATIRQEDRGRIVYWHVELDRHDVLLAEGLPAESYLDTGNRGFFADAPAAAPGPSAREAWSTRAFAPLVEEGEPLEAARARLARRAAALGAPVPEAVQVEIAGAGEWVAIIPAGATRVRVMSSRRHVEGDERRLGAAISRLALGETLLPLTSNALARGFHKPEDGFRWTDGEGLLLLPPSETARPLRIWVAALAA